MSARMACALVVAAFVVVFCSPVNTLRGCTDLRGADQCYRWYLRGHCHFGKFVGVMTRVCRNTCGTCELPEGIPQTLVTTSPPTTRPATIALTQAINVHASSCRDSITYCASFKQRGYCATSHRFNTYMKNNCKKTCGFCGTVVPTCKDKHPKTTCSQYFQHCKPGAQHHDWMKQNCPATCNLCPGPKTTNRPVVTNKPIVTKGPVVTQRPVTAKPAGTKRYPCTFDKSLCQWVNEPVDDTSDWKTGIYPTGPKQAAQGSGYLYLDSPYASGKAVLHLPWYLALPSNARDMASMCLRFKFANDQGALRVSTQSLPTETNKNPSATQLYRGSANTNGWRNVAVNLKSVPVKSTLIIEGVQGRTGGHVAIDDLAFYNGRC